MDIKQAGLQCITNLDTLSEVSRDSRMCQSALRRRLRSHALAELYDDSDEEPLGLAIYTLSDPRDIRTVRYIGQTSAPQRRFLQHLHHAQLWLPDELPWWMKKPRLRPLYAWVRELYRDECRLPVMVITAWTATPAEARAAERARIAEYLANGIALLNVEMEILHAQIARHTDCKSRRPGRA